MVWVLGSGRSEVKMRLLQAKASGNKKQKEVAGEVIRHIKLEISGLGIKEAIIHKLIAEHFKSAEPKENNLPAQKDTQASDETPASGEQQLLGCNQTCRSKHSSKTHAADLLCLP